jgi:tetratricopeptide (TPR) repeat protein
MASASLTEKGDCLRDLGRYEEAAAAYEQGIRISENLGDLRGTAVKKGQLGTVRMFQDLYSDALMAHQESRGIFADLGEPGMVAVSWHQAGMVHERAGQWEAAEQAYRQALAIRVQQNLTSDEAGTLNQLGNLYDKMGRPEEAVIFFRQAADKYVGINSLADEGLARNNLANSLIKLKRFDEARTEILRAIECRRAYGHAAEPWKSYNILCDLERAQGNREAAQAAREQAIQLYLAYRRDGGENYNPGGRLCHDFFKALKENKGAEMAAILEALLKKPEIPSYMKALIPKLQALQAGSRDPGLAADPELTYDVAAEIMWLLEELR